MSYFWTLFFWIQLILFIALILLATFGRRLGLRKLYIKLLQKLFQFSEKKVEKKRGDKFPSSSCSLDESDSVEDLQNLSFNQPKYLGVANKKKDGFQLDDILEYVTVGVSAIVEDTVLTNFIPEQPPCWNLLSRNNTRAYEFVSFQLTFLWVFGFFFRYFFLLPTRLLVLLMGMFILLLCTLFVGVVPEGPFKRKLNGRLTVFIFDFVASSLSLCATFHHPENRPKTGICVANHTSPIDSLILSTDNVYDMVSKSS